MDYKIIGGEAYIPSKVDTSGSYRSVSSKDEKISELYIRSGNPDLYVFKPKYGNNNVYINQGSVEFGLLKIALGKSKEDALSLLYELYSRIFGMTHFLNEIEKYLENARDNGYQEGKLEIQRNLKEVLNIN